MKIEPPSKPALSRKRENIATDGLSLHQGNLPFVILNGINITFSPFLIALIATSAISGIVINESFITSFLTPILLFGTIIFQAIGFILSGYLFNTRPNSLILTISGVIEPELAFSDDKKNTLKALGGCISAIFFLLISFITPLSHALASSSSIHAHIFWLFACFISVSPFILPHRFHKTTIPHNLSLKKDIILTSIVAIILFFVFTSLLPTTIGIEEIFFFIIAAGLRIFWWSRMCELSRIAQTITLKQIAVPLKTLTILSRSQTVFSAQKTALQTYQDIFPVLRGNNLYAYVTRDSILRTPSLMNEERYVSDISQKLIHCSSGDTTVEETFSYDFTFPVFILDNGELTGVVTGETIKDSLLAALSGNPKFSK